MKTTTKLRLFGGMALLFNLWLIGEYNLHGVPVFLLTAGFAVVFEFLVVKPIASAEQKSKNLPPEDRLPDDAEWKEYLDRPTITRSKSNRED